MAQKLFPILANPNAPSNFDGIDLSLSAGKMTAKNGADSFTMTAPKLVANGQEATWVDIIAAANAPDPTLQVVLDSGNTATGVNAQMTLTNDAFDAVLVSPTIVQLTSGTDNSISSQLSVSSLVIADAAVGSTLTVESLTMVDAIYNAVLSPASLAISLTADPTDNVAIGVNELVYSSGTSASTLTPTDQSFSTQTANAVYSATGAVVTGSAVSSTLSSASLVVSDPVTTATYGSSQVTMSNPLQTGTLSPASVTLSVYDDNATLTAESLVITNTVNNTTLTDGAISMTNGEFKTNVQSFEYIELNDNSNLSSASIVAGAMTVRSNPVVTAVLSSTSLDMNELGGGIASFSRASGLVFSSATTTQNTSLTAEALTSVFPNASANAGFLVNKDTVTIYNEDQGRGMQLNYNGLNISQEFSGLLQLNDNGLSATKANNGGVFNMSSTQIQIKNNADQANGVLINYSGATFTNGGDVTSLRFQDGLILNRANAGVDTTLNNSILTSTADVKLDAAGSIVLEAGADSLTLSASAMLSSSAGGSSDKYLTVLINGTTYKISLLANA